MTVNLSTPSNYPECREQPRHKAADMWLPITYVALMLILSLVGNTLVLFVYSCRWQSAGATKFSAFWGFTLYTTTGLVLVVIALSRYFKVNKIFKAVKDDHSKDQIFERVSAKVSKVVTSSRGAKITSLVVFLVAAALNTSVIEMNGNFPDQNCLFYNSTGKFSCYFACGFDTNARDKAVAFLIFKTVAFACSSAIMISLYGLVHVRVKVLEMRELEIKAKTCRSLCLDLVTKSDAVDRSAAARKLKSQSLQPIGSSEEEEAGGDCKLEYFPQLSYPGETSPQHVQSTPEADENSLNISLGSSTVCHHEAKQSQKSRNVTLMLMIITFVFTMSYLPFFVLSFKELYDNGNWCDMSLNKLIAFEVFSHSFLISSAVNPLVYGFCDPTFRRVLWRTLRWHREII
ncbi:uncharacterized protein LOC112561556 [Pomacea canaliculata]|uniref:uncharacterized protein LOC112561556 n=1 Tax=Pomacea canaliculata TaxID=400727 RepID=UPI000D738ABF|nr:uncharacterized protein LOC112561556 [Pomacea canaliculata]